VEKINFYFEGVSRIRLKQPFVKQVFKEIAVQEGSAAGEINVIFCSDAFLLDMNRSYLNHDYMTDIITFDNSREEVIAGELYISMDRVRENAEKYGVTLRHELMRVMIHGILHLLGYHDKQVKEQKVMRARENHYLSLFEIEKSY